jgi:hypothetical protein
MIGMVRPDQRERISRSRLALLYLLFFVICCGLGYPSLNRVDWRAGEGGLNDVRGYVAMVEAPPVEQETTHTAFRVLLPYMARPIYRLAKGHIGTWDPVMFSLLAVDALFVAGTALVLLMVVDGLVVSYAVGLGAALLYMLNFAVPNLRLNGMIDAGEGFFMVLLVWALWQERYWTLPLLGAVGATAKESFVPFLMVFSLAWWLCSRKELGRPPEAAAWMVAGWVAALASLTAVHWKMTGAFESPVTFAIGLHQNEAYLAHFFRSFEDRNLWYIFVWLLPLGLVRLRRLPLNWRMATAATSATAFAMDAYYGGQPGTIGRALFTVSGTLLTASVAILVFADGPREPGTKQDEHDFREPLVSANGD